MLLHDENARSAVPVSAPRTLSLGRITDLIGTPLAAVTLTLASKQSSRRAAWPCGCVAEGGDGAYTWAACAEHAALLASATA